MYLVKFVVGSEAVTVFRAVDLNEVTSYIQSMAKHCKAFGATLIVSEDTESEV